VLQQYLMPPINNSELHLVCAAERKRKWHARIAAASDKREHLLFFLFTAGGIQLSIISGRTFCVCAELSEINALAATQALFHA
jgi:hypothetical protein